MEPNSPEKGERCPSGVGDAWQEKGKKKKLRSEDQRKVTKPRARLMPEYGVRWVDRGCE